MIGDRALEIEPMRPRGGVVAMDPEWTVRETLLRLAEDIGLTFSTVKGSVRMWSAVAQPITRREAMSMTVAR